MRFSGKTALITGGGTGLIGVYSPHNSLTDCAIATRFRVFGFILRRLDRLISPIILGIVLGGLMEVKFRTSMSRVDSFIDFVGRLIAAMLFTLVALAVISHFWGIWRAWRKAPAPQR